ncbi:hypothetical protein [Dankookia sp. P2]|uniref:hypothetical protein n=1 Tax=Dankookia sp. P2 TaxID=3423955 RepID=UPI003D66D4AB
MSSATRPLSAAAAAAQARRSSLATMLAHKARCKELPPPHEAEVAAMLAAFAARGGRVTQCPTACVLPVQNGAGLALA